MKVAIVGLGLIGGSIAIDLQAASFATELCGVETNAEHVQQARSRGFCDSIAPLAEALAGADLVILCLPVDSLLNVLPSVLDQVSAQTTVTDMGSTKSALCERLKNHPRRQQYVAAHPMAGTEYSGPLAAKRGLFQNRTTVICESELSGALHLRRVDALFDALGLRKVFMSAKDHDLHAAYISHLSHISSFVLANTVLDKEKDVSAIFDLAGGGFESTVRLAKSSPEMWNPIFTQNRDNILQALNAYLEHLTVFRDSLVAQKAPATYALMKNANSISRVLQTLSLKSAGSSTAKPGRPS